MKAVISAIVCLSSLTVIAADPVAIGSRRELFVDRFLIDKLTNARLHLCEPRDEGIVLWMDRPWEGPQSGYSTVLRDGERWLMYYRGISEQGLDGSEHERTCLAESRDGITWTKPELGLFEFDGSKANNIVLANAAPVSHNFCPMLDAKPGVPHEERFKAVGGTGDKLFAFVSADGVHWKRLRDEPILSKADVPFTHIHLFDSQNLTFWSESEQSYVCYFRVWDGLRRIARSTSTDFRQWTPAVLMEQVHDDGESGPRPAPVEHLYTNQTSLYFRAPHIYVATAARFFEGRQVVSAEQARSLNINPQFYQDTSDSVFMTSRGGNVYDRTFLEGHIKPGIGLRNWVSRTNYPALNFVQTSRTEMSFYVNHDYASPTAHLRRYSLRLDGFASVRSVAAGGELLTKPFMFFGKERFRQSLSGLTVGTGFWTTGVVCLRHKMCDQPSNSGAARMVCIEYLARKHPQRDQRRVDSVLPARVNRLKCVSDRFDRQDVGKSQLAILKKLPSEEPELLRCSTVTEASHPWPPCRLWCCRGHHHT